MPFAPILETTDTAGILVALDDPGFCVVAEVIPAEQIDIIREYLDAIREEESNEKTTRASHQRVLHIAAKHRVFLEPLCHPLMLDIWSRVLGVDMMCSTWSANTIFPHSGEVYWHVDHPYWTLRAPYPVVIPLTGQAIWMLDDFTVDNGATAFIPLSHRQPRVPTLGSTWVTEASIAIGKKGSVILAHGASWHTAGINRTERPRSALLARYGRAFIIPQEDMRRQLAMIDSPNDVVRQLLGEHQYEPQKGFPY